jgi:hypothetical protein
MMAAAAPPRRPTAGLPLLTAAGVALIGTVLLGLSLPLAIWRYPWIVRTDRPLATVLGLDIAGALRFAVPVLSAFLLYAVAVRFARGMAGSRARFLVLGVTCALSLALLPMNPLGAHDVYHNVADARALWLYGDNPLVLPPDAFPNDPFHAHVPAWRTTPSLYGPLWYLIAGLPLPFAGDALWPNVVGQKLLTATLLLLLTLATMLLAERVRPGSAIRAGVLVGWNPLLQFETAGNAHNGVLMVLFGMAALLAAGRRWWPAVFPLLALSVASKYVFVVFGPVILTWMLSRRDVPRRWIVTSLLASALLGLALLLPFLGGMNMIANLLRETGFPSFSPSAFLHAALVRGFGLESLPAFTLVKLVLLILFGIGYAHVVRHVRRGSSLAALVTACFWSVGLLLVCVSAWFGPWYAALLMPLGAALTGGRPALAAAVFSASAMLMYIPYFWLLSVDPVILHGVTAGIAFVPAAVVLLWPARPALGRSGLHIGAIDGDGKEPADDSLRQRLSA